MLEKAVADQSGTAGKVALLLLLFITMRSYGVHWSTEQQPLPPQLQQPRQTIRVAAATPDDDVTSRNCRRYHNNGQTGNIMLRPQHLQGMWQLVMT